MRIPRAQSGTTVLEVTVFVAVIAPVMVALAATVSVFGSTTQASQHRATAVGQNQRILQKIIAELSMTTTKRDHLLTGGAMTPQYEKFGPGESNTAYNYLASGVAPAMDTTHDTFERDQNEYWHPQWDKRRYYIYKTYESFDTIEFQKVRTPTDMNHVNVTAGTVTQPWSNRRKIVRYDDGRVVLIVESPGQAQPRVVTLGTNVTLLKFHLNVDGHIIIRLSTSSGRDGGQEPNGGTIPNSKGARRETQITVNPRNGLS